MTKEEQAKHQRFMRLCIKQAQKAAGLGEVPVGALIERDGKVIAYGYNRRETAPDGTAHAEIEAIRKAGKKLGVWNLSGCNLYVTLEPCVMCAGAVINARINTVIFGAYDLRFGACGSVISVPDDTRFNHRATIVGGVLQPECAKLLQDFFRARR